jgi:hypothetical protein
MLKTNQQIEEEFDTVFPSILYAGAPRTSLIKTFINKQRAEDLRAVIEMVAKIEPPKSSDGMTTGALIVLGEVHGLLQEQLSALEK